MKHKKVLFILQNLEGGGAEKVFVHIANGFASNGFDVEILLGENTGDYFTFLNADIKISFLKARTFVDYLVKLPVFFKDKSYSSVFTASDYISAATIMAKRIVRGRFQTIVTLHYHLPYQLSVLSPLNRKWLLWLNSNILTRANKIVAVSNGVNIGFREVTKKTGYYPITIYNPVIDDSIFEFANESIEDVFSDRPFIITVGALIEQKNQLLLLEAFKKFSEKFTNFDLLILGTGPKEIALKKFVDDNKLTAKVYFVGFQKNPFKYIKKAQLFVLSSDCEGLGNVIIEALGLGINVVSTDCPSGPREIVEDGKYGWLAKVNDSDDLAIKMQHALLYPKPTSLLQTRGNHFLISNSIAQYLLLD